jgi:hypothetical protein
MATPGGSWNGYIANFGQDSSFAGRKTAQGYQDSNDIGDFYYTPPTGFLALCTSNLPDVAVTPSEHFNTVLYTGDGNSTQAITGVGFQPDFLWIKNRSAGNVHSLQDVIRTPDAVLQSQTTEGENATRAYINSFDSDGFTTGNAAGASKGPSNNDGDTYVGWNWKAGGSGVSNTAGDINSTVSANTDAGFSIVSYTGNGNSSETIGHGLSKAPELIIQKARSGTHHWPVYHKYAASDAETDYLWLDDTKAVTDYDNYWADTAPTSTVFTVDNDGSVNGSGTACIAYCFHSVDGYSKVGSYKGNQPAGSASQFDGTFEYTGFRPAYVMIRRAKTSGTADWLVFDNTRNVYNPVDKFLEPNTSDTESTASSSGYEIDLDFVSNGFKLKGPAGGIGSNSADAPYIYLAFAETPFKYANAR